MKGEDGNRLSGKGETLGQKSNKHQWGGLGETAVEQWKNQYGWAQPRWCLEESSRKQY